MKVAFINPKGYLQADEWMPLGAIQLATVLTAEHEVLLVDEEHFEIEIDRVQECNVICITGMSHQASGIDRWIALANEWNKRVIVGGVHATLNPEMIKNAFVVVGPGEKVLPNLLEGPPRQEVIHALPIKNLNKLPFPMRKEFGWNSYSEMYDNKPAIRVLAARGCPFGCRFCCNRRLTKGRFELRNPADVAEEISVAIQNLGIGSVVFAMSVFTLSRNWTVKMCRKLKALGVRWKATTRVDLVDRELLEVIKEGGCKALGFGVESGHNEILKILNKGTTTNQIRETFELAKKIDLPTFAMFMTHVPGETPETLSITKRFAEELDPPLGATFQRFSPLPGSPFFEEIHTWGQLVKREETQGFGPMGFIPYGFISDNQSEGLSA